MVLHLPGTSVFTLVPNGVPCCLDGAVTCFSPVVADPAHCPCSCFGEVTDGQVFGEVMVRSFSYLLIIFNCGV